MQPKATTFPTDAKLLHAASKGLNRLSTRHGVRPAAMTTLAWPGRGDDGAHANSPNDISDSCAPGPKRGVSGTIKRDLRPRSAIDPIIGHLKAEDYLGLFNLKGSAGNVANVVLSAMGH